MKFWIHGGWSAGSPRMQDSGPAVKTDVAGSAETTVFAGASEAKIREIWNTTFDFFERTLAR